MKQNLFSLAISCVMFTSISAMQLENINHEQESRERESRLRNSVFFDNEINSSPNDPMRIQLDDVIPALFSTPLPHELVCHILSSQDSRQLINLGYVSKAWYLLIHHDPLFCHFGKELADDYADGKMTSARYNQHLLKVKVNMLTDLTAVEEMVTRHNLFLENVRFVSSGKFSNFFSSRASGEKRLQQLIADFAAKRDPLAICIYLTEFPSHEAVILNDKLVAQHNERASLMKYYGLMKGEYGYPQDIPAAVILNDQLAEEGSADAIIKKAYGLDGGKDGYTHNPSQAAAFIEQFAEQGYEEAILIKMGDLEYGGGFVCEQNIEKLRIYIENLIETVKNKLFLQSLIKQKIHGLIEGSSGYIKDLAQASSCLQRYIDIDGEDIEFVARHCPEIIDVQYVVPFIERHAKQGNKKAIEIKYRGLMYGMYGYEESPEKALAYLELLAEQGNELAFQTGRLTNEFLDQLVAQGNKVAIRHKLKKIMSIENYSNSAAIKLMHQLAQAGDDEIILEELKLSRDYHKKCYGGKDDKFNGCQIIEQHERKGIRSAQYLKAFGLKYGIFGYTKDDEKAKEYIRKHLIAY